MKLAINIHYISRHCWKTFKGQGRDQMNSPIMTEAYVSMAYRRGLLVVDLSWLVFIPRFSYSLLLLLYRPREDNELTADDIIAAQM